MFGSAERNDAAVLLYERTDPCSTIGAHQHLEHVLNVGLGVGTLGGKLQGVREVVLHDAANGAVQSGREQQHLALFRNTIKDAFHARQKAHVRHSVCLVDHDHAHISQVDVTTFHEVFEAPRGRNNDRAAAQSLHLRAIPCATKYRCGEELPVDIEQVNFSLHLLGQFSRRHEHEATRATLCELSQSLDQNQPECNGLTRPGRCLATDVAAAQSRRHGESLNLRGLCNLSLRKRRHQRLGDAQ